VQYYRTYEEVYGEDKATELLQSAKESVDIVLDSLDKELAYNAVLFLGFRIELSHIYELFTTILLILFGVY
jgi:hypothetical protein